jgi:hypothetical protein
MRKVFASIAAVMSLTVAASALATPVGTWQVKQYDFVRGTPINTVQMCLNVDGAASQAGWTGYWALSQSGANMMARQKQTTAGGSAAYFATVVTDDLMTGFNESWPSNSLSGGYYTVSVWHRLSHSC